MQVRWWRIAAGVAVWLVVTVALWPVLFTHASARTVVASHDAVVQPTLDLDGDDHDGLDAAVDAVAARFGSGAMTRGSLVRRGQGIAVPLLPDA